MRHATNTQHQKTRTDVTSVPSSQSLGRAAAPLTVGEGGGCGDGAAATTVAAARARAAAVPAAAVPAAAARAAGCVVVGWVAAATIIHQI